MIQKLVAEFVILLLVSWLVTAIVITEFGEFMVVNNDMREEYVIVLLFLSILRGIFVYRK